MVKNEDNNGGTRKYFNLLKSMKAEKPNTDGNGICVDCGMGLTMSNGFRCEDGRFRCNEHYVKGTMFGNYTSIKSDLFTTTKNHTNASRFM